jgi:hypothetical protein
MLDCWMMFSSSITSDIQLLTAWCEDNLLPLNVNKCKTLIFTRLLHHIIVSYVLNGKILERVCSMTDLGVILDSKLSFRFCRQQMFRYVWLYKALVTGIRDPYTLKVLYVTYVRSKLEYANFV